MSTWKERNKTVSIYRWHKNPRESTTTKNLLEIITKYSKYAGYDAFLDTNNKNLEFEILKMSFTVAFQRC